MRTNITTFLNLALTIGVVSSLLPEKVSAQTPPAEQKLEAIEKQIQSLKGLLDELRQTLPSSAGSTNRPETSGARPLNTNDPIARIRDEGFNRSQVMKTLSYLTDVIGPRLTGSPNLRRANEWTRDTMASWGLKNARLEAWGPFGRGWSLKRFSAQIVEPYTIPLIGQPKAWSSGFDQPFVADVVYIDARTEADLDKYKGKLKGAVVLTSPIREVKARFEPLAIRLTETNLLRLANAGDTRVLPTQFSPTNTPLAGGRGRGNFGRRGGAGATNAIAEASPSESGRGPGRRGGGPGGAQFSFQTRLLTFLTNEQARVIISSSGQGDGGTLFVLSASVPGATPRNTNAPPGTPRLTAWSTNAPPIPAQITLAVEDYNRLVRMIEQGEKLKMAVDLQVEYHNDDLMAYNTTAELPGTDLKDEIVMVGGHMDSWHSGTGATDNGAGVAAAMEAVRILKALDLKPRRTIRVGLWTGEEEGLLGSKAYVAQHFGYQTNITTTLASSSSSSASENGSSSSSSETVVTNTTTRRTWVRHGDFEKLSAYFNLDNGTGKIRGVYMQGNEAVRPIFRRWLQPFSDLGAETLSLSNTGGTDHLSFDEIGLPGFQFIQDPVEYNTRTHHSNEDVFDRIQGDDLKQAAVIMAAFLYQTAMMDEKLPRKPAPSN